MFGLPWWALVGVLGLSCDVVGALILAFPLEIGVRLPGGRDSNGLGRSRSRSAENGSVEPFAILAWSSRDAGSRLRCH